MNKIKLSFIILILLLTSCTASQKSGYSDLDELHRDFVTNLRENDVPGLYEYCLSIYPDQKSIEYMKKNDFSYRGIPNELERYKIKTSDLCALYFERVLAFRNKLLRKRQLQDLKYIGKEKDKVSIHDKELDIYFTSTFILMESKGDTIKCNLGELLRINGKWQTFTEPKLGW